MRSFGFGLSSLTLVTLTLAAVACGGTKTIYVTGSSSGDPTTPADPTDPTATDPTTPDPSQSGDPTDPTTPSPALVDGLAITDISVYQGSSVPVVTSGKAIAKASRNSPVVVGRDALVRVFVSPGSGFTSKSVAAELRLVSGTTRLATIKDTKTIKTDSTEASPDSTFNFDVPAADLPAGVTYQVFLTDPSGTVPSGTSTARFPNAGGVQDLQAETSGGLKVVVVPITINGYHADVSATQLALYKSAFMGRYPATDVTVTARAEWSYTGTISASGSGWSNALMALQSLRRTDGVAADVYYYGAFANASSFQAFCSGGCVAGLSGVVDSASSQGAFQRASIGVGWTGANSTDTAVHEVGHAHGREHAPCNHPSGIDPDFPYSDGSIGVWGYDITAKKLINPSVGTDMMGYCDNTWVSDYTYGALFDRIAQVDGGNASARSGGASAIKASGPASAVPVAAQSYRLAAIDGTGTLTWGADIDLDEEPDSAEVRPVQFLGNAGQLVGTHDAHFYNFDHLPGGILVVPSSPIAAAGVSAQVAKSWSQVKVSGVANVLAR